MSEGPMKNDMYPSMTFMKTTTDYYFLKEMRERETLYLGVNKWLNEEPKVTRPKMIYNFDYLASVILLVGYVLNCKHPLDMQDIYDLQDVTKDQILDAVYQPSELREIFDNIFRLWDSMEDVGLDAYAESLKDIALQEEAEDKKEEARNKKNPVNSDSKSDPSDDEDAEENGVNEYQQQSASAGIDKADEDQSEQDKDDEDAEEDGVNEYQQQSASAGIDKADEDQPLMIEDESEHG